MQKSETSGLRTISPQDLAMLGMQRVAYVRATLIEDKLAWVLCAADGREMAAFADRDVAQAAARQNDLEPLSLH
ncbi:MAG: DUF1150 family protein [Alphaproteobacteria bacterium]